MSSYTRHTTITGRIIFVRENVSKRQFTIKTTSGKYRTLPMSKQEFNNCRHNTGQDWQQFLKSEAYFTIK